MWINGIEKNNININDRSIHFGDGCFTTAAVKDGKIILLKYHLQRLKFTCKKLLIFGVNWQYLKKEICNIANYKKNGILKIIITAGNVKQGYSRSNCIEPNRIIYFSNWSQNHINYDLYLKEGIKMTISPIRIAKNKQFAGLKHLNRLEQVMIKIHLDKSNYDEALVLDTEGYVIECCSANLFWRKGNKVFTPSLSESGINGIMKYYLIKKMRLIGQKCQIIKSKLKEVLSSDEIIICNTLMPFLPVKSIQSINFTNRLLFNRLQILFKNWKIR